MRTSSSSTRHQVEAQGTNRVRRWREWERPAPSTIWLAMAIAFASFAFAAALAALTVANGVSLTPSELWIAAGLLFLCAVLCGAAHIDSTVVRTSREREVEEIEQEGT